MITDPQLGRRDPQIVTVQICHVHPSRSTFYRVPLIIRFQYTVIGNCPCYGVCMSQSQLLDAVIGVTIKLSSFCVEVRSWPVAVFLAVLWPLTGSGVVRIDPLHFLTGCRTR